MFDVKRYREVTNDFIKIHTEKIIDSYKHELRWDHHEEVLDVGCGEGSTTINILEKLISTRTKTYRILGTDLLDTMIKVANDTYSNHERVKFKQADILDEQAWLSFKGYFHKVFSILCLMIVPNPKIWVKNMYNILKPNGQVLLMLTTANPMVDQHFYMSRQNKWSKYQKDNIFNTDFFTANDKKSWLVQHLQEGGFKNIVCHNVYYDTSLKDAESSYRFIKPFKALYEPIPTELREEYVWEMCRNIENNVIINENYAKISYVIVIAEK